MTPTQTETIGLGEDLLAQMDKEAAALEKGGMNLKVAKPRLEIAVEEAKAANALQESLKHQLTSATKLCVEKMRQAYIIESSTLDMMMGAVEKTSPIAKVLQRFRSRLRRRDDGEDLVPLPEPAHEAVK